MRISDWSSDVCSADLQAVRQVFPKNRPVLVRISSIDGVDIGWSVNDSISLARALAGIGIDAIVCSSGGVTLPKGHVLASRSPGFQEIGRASCREGVCMYVSISGVALSLKKKNK